MNGWSGASPEARRYRAAIIVRLLALAMESFATQTDLTSDQPLRLANDPDLTVRTTVR
jgi:hypothetical protein